MPRSLVPGRGHGKQLHRCSLCNCTGHRQETCPSAAGELIRSLRKQLREKGRTAKKKQQTRRNFVFHKGTWRKEAAQRYSGRDTTSQQMDAVVTRMLTFCVSVCHTNGCCGYTDVNILRIRMLHKWMLWLHGC